MQQTLGTVIVACAGGSFVSGVNYLISKVYPLPVCSPCPAGAVSSAGSSACTNCPEGSFASPGATACTPCPDGTSSPALSGSQLNCSCLPGYAPASAGAPGGACAPCLVPNTYSNGSACAPCPAGSTSPPLSPGLNSCTCGDGRQPSATGGCSKAPAPAVVSSGISGSALGGALGGFAVVAVAAALLARRHLRRRSAEAVAAAEAAAAAAAAESGWKAVVALACEIELGRKLGAGGFGAVHAATWRGTLVAVKVLGAEAASRLLSRTATAGGADRTAASQQQQQRRTSAQRAAALLAATWLPGGGGLAAGRGLPAGSTPPPPQQPRTSTAAISSVDPAFAREVTLTFAHSPFLSHTPALSPRSCSSPSCGTQTARRAGWSLVVAAPPTMQSRAHSPPPHPAPPRAQSSPCMPW